MNDRGHCRTAPATPGLLKIGTLSWHEEIVGLVCQSMWRSRAGIRHGQLAP